MGILKTIWLSNFRNYENLYLELKAGINVLIGGNGQGKTSLLEAIYFLSVLRSFRSQQVKNLFRWEQNSFSVKGIIRDDTLSKTLEICYGEKRKLLLNGCSVYKTSELLGQFLCTAFVPEDIKLVKGTGIERRRFLDTSLSVLYPHYLSLVQNYYKTLKSRNILLKQESSNLRLIESFDSILIHTGARITFYRTQFCRVLAENMLALSQDMLLYQNELKLVYKYSYSLDEAMNTVNDIEDALRAAFRKNTRKDLDYRLTHIGPHRETFTLLLNQRLLQDYGSEGQCRLAVLILKMATGEFFLHECNDESIIFLVDDITGELDTYHRQVFYKLLGRADQVFFACTDAATLDEIPASIIFDICQGKATIRMKS